ncbi:MAG: GntR family transcriptional regulator [Methanimicrococcus sp.]|nr:GntR family transcriptional regulator [Methanimicrococcus sp.]
MKVKIPKYQQIAADIAAKIARGDYPEGEKIYVRSALASQYGVSSETARRAVWVLADMNIVETTKGSGVLIKSKKRAAEYIDKFDAVSQMSDLKQNILNNLDRQTAQNNELKELVSDLVYRMERFQSFNPFSVFDIEVTPKASVLGQNLSECRFWHNTAATIIGIRSGDDMFLSPGPYAVLSEGNVLYYVGDEGCHERVQNFLYPPL